MLAGARCHRWVAEIAKAGAGAGAALFVACVCHPPLFSIVIKSFASGSSEEQILGVQFNRHDGNNVGSYLCLFSIFVDFLFVCLFLAQLATAPASASS